MNSGPTIAKLQIPSDFSFDPAAPIRIGDYLVGKFSMLPSRKSIKRSLKSGLIILNGKKATTGSWVKAGDIIELFSSFSAPKLLYELSMELIYEDEHIAVINKPGGIPVSGNTFRTVYNTLGYFLCIDHLQNFYPQPAHRLDSATSGLLLIAKTLKARIRLGEQFANKTIHKSYQAIVHGSIALSGQINIPIDRKKASTLFDRVASHHTKNKLTFSHVLLRPLTGRTHQLRKHCLAMGHPILGDQLYRQKGWQFEKKGLLLCACGLSFDHPITGEFIELRIDPPAKFQKVMQKP